MPDLEIEPETPTVGATIHGLDLAQPLSPAMADRLYEGLIEHLVLFFPDQHGITPDGLLGLGRAMGPIGAAHHSYPTLPGHADVVVLDWPTNGAPDAAEWHSDLSYRPERSFATILRAVELPPTGGDTLWASMYAVYDSLGAGLRSELAGLHAVHDMGAFRNAYFERGGNEALNAAMHDVGSAVHPVVGHHPATGRPFLQVSEAFTTHIIGMTLADGQRLLHYLFGVINRPDFQVRLRWRPNTVAMWDNRAAQHYACVDYLPHRRVMHRVVVGADSRLSDLRSESS